MNIDPYIRFCLRTFNVWKSSNVYTGQLCSGGYINNCVVEIWRCMGWFGRETIARCDLCSWFDRARAFYSVFTALALRGFSVVVIHYGTFRGFIQPIQLQYSMYLVQFCGSWICIAWRINIEEDTHKLAVSNRKITFFCILDHLFV